MIEILAGRPITRADRQRYAKNRTEPLSHYVDEAAEHDHAYFMARTRCVERVAVGVISLFVGFYLGWTFVGWFA